jgi:hypothetical protein
MSSILRMMSPPIFEFERLLWFFKIIVCCMASFGIGWFLIFSLRKTSRKTTKLTKLYFVVLAAPITVYIILSMSVRYSMCERAVADGFSFGVVMGILCNLSRPPSERGSVQLIAHQVNGKKHSVWLDSKDVLVGDARNAIAESMHIVPASRICIESGRGSFLDDLNAKLFRYLVGTTIKVNFFGFTTISCYISIKDEEIVVSPIDEDKTNQRDRSNTHFRSLISNIKGEARYGHQLMLTAKVATANHDVRPLFVTPVEKFAAAAPIQQLAVPSTLSACKNVRLLSWNAVNAAAPPSEIGGSDLGDNHTIQSSGSNCPPVPTSALSRSRSIIDTANRLYKSALQPSDESIRNGDLVVIECDGK